MSTVRWPEVDPADWQPERPEPKLDEEIIALACFEAAKRILHKRLGKLRVARAAMAHAYDRVHREAHEVELAIGLVEQSAREWAVTKGGNT